MNDRSSMHVTHWGETGTRIVMVHGSVQGSRIEGRQHFAAQEILASRGWRILVPDRPGHGRSAAPGRPDDGMLDGALIADLLGDGAHLVGHSFGGVVALCAASQRPEAVRSLTLIEPALHQLATAHPDVQAFFKQQIAIFTSGKAPAEILADFSRVAGIPPSLRQGPADLEEATRVGQSLLAVHFPPDDALRRCMATIAAAKIPVLFVTGGWNPAFDASASILAPQMNGEHRVVAAPHHFPQLESEAFNRLLEDFMRNADRART